VFGRGGEEIDFLRKHGVSFEVIPGITAAQGCAAAARIPLTHRGLSSSFAVITGHEASQSACKEGAKIDWAGLARAVDTLVILMGLKNLPHIVAELIANGRAPDTPAAAIRWGTTESQQVVEGILSDIVEKAGRLGPPVVIVVGDVVELRSRLQWFFPHKDTAQSVKSLQDADQLTSRP